MKKIAILGSTGSIGTQTLEVVRNNPELQVVALAAGKSVEQMEQQIREFHPLIAGMWSEEAAADLRSRVADLPVKVVTGMDGLLEIAVMPEAQVLVTAIVVLVPFHFLLRSMPVQGHPQTFHMLPAYLRPVSYILEYPEM